MFASLPAAMNSPDNPMTEAKVKLGKILYYDPRLSANQKISCNTSYPFDAYGAEATRVSTGHKNQKGTRNAPTVYNAGRAFCAVLGWPRPHRRGAGKRADHQPGGDGDALQCCGRGSDKVYGGVRRCLPRSLPQRQRPDLPTTTWHWGLEHSSVDW